MNDWNDRSAKRAAKTKFWTELKKPENKQLRAQCVQDPATARATFAKFGEFYLEENLPPGSQNVPIPRDTEFRVFEDDLPSRDKMVTLVLRDNLTGQEPYDSQQIWQCSWFPYA
jgi:hypothetical protein